MHQALAALFLIALHLDSAESKQHWLTGSGFVMFARGSVTDLYERHANVVDRPIAVARINAAYVAAVILYMPVKWDFLTVSKLPISHQYG